MEWQLVADRRECDDNTAVNPRKLRRHLPHRTGILLRGPRIASIIGVQLYQRRTTLARLTTLPAVYRSTSGVRLYSGRTSPGELAIYQQHALPPRVILPVDSGLPLYLSA